jgi:translation elongation factor EF-1alpha
MAINNGKETWTMSGKLIGEVTHFYNRIGVAVIDLSGSVQLGDQVHFLGRSTDFRQDVQSMQIEHQSITEAGKGEEIAMKVERRVRKSDRVYKLADDE